MMRKVVCGLLGLAAAVAGAPVVHACAQMQPLDIADIARATLVVRGRVAEYSRFPLSDEPPINHAALIRFEVTETWRGLERAGWVMFWVNSEPPPPETWPFGEDAVIAAQPAMASLRVGPDDGKDQSEAGESHMLIMQISCAPPLIFRTSPPEDEVAAWRRETDGIREMMKQMPSERMRERLERMLGASPEKTYRRRMAALRACVEEDMETCKAVWRGQ